ncbi:LEAF RUST 10 DISEASE-RESISTANCE LOCUS RECEPTOR-LIKE PROTEIN KINASE-like 1.1 isoform X2 [Camellia sinensis]|uniref:LEAF RUST 10 DISEASE-RESISTANCE LOCUS RECEPTOR-LIKE PROTEIN KINASE-like 1.1 isoform X2 n=1 Tax=Camellia sinensis TaxID=4442 RepID=UPI00103620F7|nr:LEAF RUST 10 DISEASE-RESISTANCE LOCUS RECEPTOR-LIKE PROTEIN KINASE-like 1.1 isoform X2 [Camellia sinensis]
MDVPFFRAIFLLSHLLLLHSFSAKEDNKNQNTCPKSFDCKPFHQPLSFPFSNSMYPQCGLCTVTCDEPSKIQLGNEGRWYDVVAIEEKLSGIILQIRDQFLKTQIGNESCDVFKNLSFPNTSSISFTVDPPYLTFFKCNKSFPFVSPKDHFHNYTNCNDYNLYYKYSSDYKDPDHQSSPSVPLSPSCSVIQLPLNFLNTNSNEDDPFNLLTHTFSLELHVSEDCQRCYQEEGGQCQNDNQKFHCATTNKGTKHRWILAAALPGGVICLLIFIISCRKKWDYISSCFVSRKTSSNPSSKDDIEGGTIFFGVHVFSYTELEEATNNFDPFQELGDGGFGTVYHGKLRDGREVAVKRLYEHNYKRVTQFINEVQILTCLRHRNLVSLYGCTSRHSRELLLVYEYIPNGTVADHLHGDRAKNASLTWPVRMNIAIETASALTYLHASDIIHRDIKTNNILLDNNFCVKVADFGLSRLFPTDVTHVSTAPQGTPGYVDPEYHQCYQLTDKSDVYSFGVVLIELISSLRAVDIRRHGHEINLADLATNRIQNRAFDELIDPFLGFDSDSLIERMTTLVAELAFQCLQREKEMRPTMDEVLEALKEIQEYKYDNIRGEIDTVGVLNCTQPPPSPETDDVVLLKNSKAALSPDSVTDGSVSTSATSISSG